MISSPAQMPRFPDFKVAQWQAHRPARNSWVAQWQVHRPASRNTWVAQWHILAVASTVGQWQRGLASKYLLATSLQATAAAAATATTTATEQNLGLFTSTLSLFEQRGVKASHRQVKSHY